MTQRGINLENVKIRNRSAILKLLRSNGAMSRKDIAEKLKLTQGAVTQLCTEMIENGIICEIGEMKEKIRAGRKKVLVDINYQSKCIIAVTIESEHTFLSLCDLKGHILFSQRIESNTSGAPEEFLTTIAHCCTSLLNESGACNERVLGMGICIPGPVDRKEGVSEHAYGIWSVPVAVRAIMRRQFDFPIIVENNVKAYAEGELIYGAGRKNDNMLFVKWGPGVGSAIVINSEIYGGRNNASAEIGHYIIEPGGRQCRCGRRGCLETIVSSRSILNQVLAIFSLEKTPHLYEKLQGDETKLSMESIGQWQYIKDAGVLAIINDCIKQFACTVVNVITILAPECVILYGFILEDPYILATFLEYCKEYESTFEDSNFIKSNLSVRIHHIGPVAVVAREFFFENGGLPSGGS